MGIFSKFKKKELRSETENTVTVDFMRDLMTGVLTREATLNIPTVAGCISKISETVARLPIKLYQKNDDKITEISDDSRLVLLNGETGDTLNSVEMWRAVIEDFFVGRGGWIYINSDGLRVKGLHYVDSRSISLMKNTDPIFKAYNITVNGIKYYDFQFIKLLRKTRDGCTNIPMQEEYYQIFSAVFNALKLENLMSKNGGCKPGFLKSKVRLATDAINKIRQNYANVYDNEQIRDKIIVLNEGMDFQPISSTAAELQLNENKRVNSMEICKLFGFPHSVVDGNATPDDNKKFISAVIAVLNQIETALDSSLLLETEKEQGFYFAFDTKELTRGDMKERYEAYDIAVRNNILQIDEIRKEEDYEPLGFNYMKLGLSDVLYDPKTDHVFVPNTGQTTDMKTGSEVRARKYIQLPNGKMNGSKNVGGGGSSSGGSSSGKGVDKSGESGIIDTGAISGALSPESEEAQKHAEQYYESVRKMKTDIRNIAKNTGFSEDDISQIKNHVFIEEHDLGGDFPERFYPSYAMAQSWQRLIDGRNIQKHDITLLEHERMESNLMKKGYSQEKAHHLTEKQFNYAKESREYYVEIDKHRKRKK